jgi:hypothetical protein
MHHLPNFASTEFLVCADEWVIGCFYPFAPGWADWVFLRMAPLTPPSTVSTRSGKRAGKRVSSRPL